MFYSEAENHEDSDMDLSNVDSANFDAMVAEEAILDWLVNIESENTEQELTDRDEILNERARMAN